MPARALEQRARHHVIRLAYAGLDSHTLRREVLRALRRVVPVDAAFFATLDPATLLFTDALTEGPSRMQRSVS